MPPDEQDIVVAKRTLRTGAADLRRQAVAALPPAEAGRKVRDALAAAIVLPRGAPVSAYWPLDGELDTRPLIEHLHAAGHPIGLPVVVGRGQPLSFRRWHPGIEMAAGAFRVLTPPPEAPELTPAAVLAPLLAFDSAGFRLGYGGGFYDRTLAQLRGMGPVLCIGIAYAAQEVASVPREPTDQPLDWIVTEEGARRIGGSFGSGNRY